MTVERPMMTNHTERTTALRATVTPVGSRRTLLCSVVIAFAALSVAPAATEERGSSPSPVTLDPPGSVDTFPFGISESGDIVGRYVTADTKNHGFLLTRGVYTSIDVPGAIRTNAIGIAELRPQSNDNDHAPSRGAHRRLAVVGRYDTPDNIAHGYRLSDGVLTTIDVPGATFTTAAGINSSGHVVGRYLSADGVLHGFLFVDGEFTTIDYPGGSAIYGIAINAKGDIAGYYGDATRRSHAFLLSDGVFTTIDPLDSLETGTNGGVIGINSREVVGYYRVSPATPPCLCDGLRAFTFNIRDGSYTTFALPDSKSTCFFGINRRGDVVGNYHDGTRNHGLLSPRGGHE